MPTGDQSNASHVQLAGWIENPRNAQTLKTHTLKEVVVFQTPPSVNVFNVVEYGRRILECLSINLTYPYAVMRLKESLILIVS